MMIKTYSPSEGGGDAKENRTEQKSFENWGKARGRRYRIKVGPLIVTSKDKGISKAVKNLIGVNVCRVENLSAEHLAPGASCGRLTLYTRSAIEKLK